MVELQRTITPLVTTIPVRRSYPPMTSVARLSIALNIGDFVDLDGWVEATTPYTWVTTWYRFLKESSINSPDPGEGTILSRAMGFGFTQQPMHHGVSGCGGHFIAASTRAHYFLLVCYAVAYYGTTTTKLDCNYVDLSASIIRA